VSIQPTGTVTFLFTDIADHARRWEEFPSEMPGCARGHGREMRLAEQLRFLHRELAEHATESSGTATSR
jgi:hypothetical protein